MRPDAEPTRQLEVFGLCLCIVIGLPPASRVSGARCSAARASAIVRQARQAIDPAIYPARRTTHEGMATSPTLLLPYSLTPSSSSSPTTSSPPQSLYHAPSSPRRCRSLSLRMSPSRPCGDAAHLYLTSLPCRPVHSTAYRSAAQHAPLTSAGGMRGTGTNSTQLESLATLLSRRQAVHTVGSR